MREVAQTAQQRASITLERVPTFLVIIVFVVIIIFVVIIGYLI